MTAYFPPDTIPDFGKNLTRFRTNVQYANVAISYLFLVPWNANAPRICILDTPGVKLPQITEHVDKLRACFDPLPGTLSVVVEHKYIRMLVMINLV